VEPITIRMSAEIGAISKAMAAFQATVENASKKSINPAFKSKYADLAEVLNTVREDLGKHGLALMQFPSFQDGVAHVETILSHESGQWMAGLASAPVTKQDAQGVGSAITYLRRYSIAAVCGVAQEDDDANGSVGRKADKQEDPSAALIAPILAAPDMDKLRKAYDAAYKVAKTKEAQAAVIAAKDQRKTELQVAA
jgi:hypothetical protein